MKAASGRCVAFRGLLLCGGILAGGCGLSDYEKRIDERAAQLQQFDDEHKALGEPLEMPVIARKDKKGNLEALPALEVEMFLRPPRWILARVKDGDGPFEFKKVALYRYPGAAGYNLLIGTARVAVVAKDQKVEGIGLTTEQFQREVRGALVDFYQKENKTSPMGWLEQAKTETQTRQAQAPTGPVNLVFETQTLTDAAKEPSLYLLFFHAQGNFQGAVVFQVPASKSTDPAVQKGLDWSLKSLALGPDVPGKRQEYLKLKRGS